jgi:hypothetical protein
MATITGSMDTQDASPDTSSNVKDTPTTVPKTNLEEYELTKSNITNLGTKVRLTDSDENNGLELYCYVHCSTADNPLLQQCRGVVFDKDKVVMKAFPYTVEYSHTDTDCLEDFSSCIKDCAFYDSHEGTLIRMFYFDKKWYTSTHRKLNAFRSKWASRESFGSSFKRALEYEITVNEKLKQSIPEGDEGMLERFQSTLDKEKQYMFLVRNCPENRIVCKSPNNPTVYHVGTFVDGVLDLNVSCNLNFPTKHNFNSVEELVNYVENVDIRYLQGIICFAPNNKQYKIMHKEYQNLFKARGNEPSIKFRYLQIRMNRHTSDILYHLYPELRLVFEETENSIYEIAKNIYTAYVQRFIKKRFVTVPAEEFAVIRECHKWHEENRIVNRISVDKVINVLNQQSPTNINRMIRRFRTEKDNKIVQQKISQETVKTNTVPSTPNSSPPPPKSPTHIVSPLNLPQKTRLGVPVMSLG